MVDGAHGFRVVKISKISSGFRCAHLFFGNVGVKILMHFMVLYLKLWYSFYIRVEHGGYMKIIWREERNLCAQHHPPRGSSDADREPGEPSSTCWIRSRRITRTGGKDGKDGRGGGELQGRGWAAIRKTPPAS